VGGESKLWCSNERWPIGVLTTNQIVKGAAETRHLTELAVTDGYETNLSAPYSFAIRVDMR
jgi:hypothetical protein